MHQGRQVGRGGALRKEKHLISAWGSRQRASGESQWSTWDAYEKSHKFSFSHRSHQRPAVQHLLSVTQQPTLLLHCCWGSVFSSAAAAWPGKAPSAHSMTVREAAPNWGISVKRKEEEHSSVTVYSIRKATLILNCKPSQKTVSQTRSLYWVLMNYRNLPVLLFIWLYLCHTAWYEVLNN